MTRFERFAERRPGLVSAGLFVLFFGLYGTLGLRLFAGEPWRNDEFFEIDAARVAEWMTRPEALHLRTRVHPIYVLLVNPIGVLLERALGQAATAVQVLTASFAAAAVAIFHLAVSRWKRDPWIALGVALLFGFAASQMLLGLVPDTTGLATLGLASALFLYVRDRERASLSSWPWLAVGALALGVTTTNLVPVVCLYFALCVRLEPHGVSGAARAAVGRTMLGVVAVVVLVGLLALLQQAIYSNTKLFFQPQLIGHEIQKFSSLVVFETPVAVLSEVFKHFLVAGVVAPLPREIFIHGRPAITFVGSFGFYGLGWLAALGWLGLLAAALRALMLQSAERRLAAACAAALAFQLVMHCFYGVAERGKMELFLYTGNATLLVIALASIGLASHSRWSRAWLAALVLATAATSFDMLERIAWITGRFT